MTRMPLWLPTLLVIVVTALALTAAGSPPAAPGSRRRWTVSILVFGCLAIAATVWLGRREAEETAALAGTSAAPQVPPAALNGPSVSDLNRRIKALEDHVKELEAGKQARSITQTSADEVASYLSQFASRRVIVSEDIWRHPVAGDKCLRQRRRPFRHSQDPVGRVCEIQYSLPEPGDAQRGHSGHRNRRAFRRDGAVAARKRRRRLIGLIEIKPAGSARRTSRQHARRSRRGSSARFLGRVPGKIREQIP